MHCFGVAVALGDSDDGEEPGTISFLAPRQLARQVGPGFIFTDADLRDVEGLSFPLLTAAEAPAAKPAVPAPVSANHSIPPNRDEGWGDGDGLMSDEELEGLQEVGEGAQYEAQLREYETRTTRTPASAGVAPATPAHTRPAPQPRPRPNTAPQPGIATAMRERKEVADSYRGHLPEGLRQSLIDTANSYRMLAKLLGAGTPSPTDIRSMVISNMIEWHRQSNARPSDDPSQQEPIQ
jgi:hypothetical protein